ncbi:MAG: hypothetical protein JJU13_17060 [Balneolaceae bacterium]|nr:hypothetical protein [Balneolaceae bacterium]
MMIKINSISIIVLLVVLISCSDDSTGPEANDLGEASFVISGAVEGQKEGFANFRAFEMSGVHTWDILIIDAQPRSFEISISAFSNEPLSRPSTGTYQLGLTQDSDYAASYSEGSLAQPDSYTTTFNENTGTLVITSSSDDEIEGTFEFTAVNIDEEDTEQISISNGQFRAVPRVGGIAQD